MQATLANGPMLGATVLLALQRTAGNAAVTALLGNAGPAVRVVRRCGSDTPCGCHEEAEGGGRPTVTREVAPDQEEDQSGELVVTYVKPCYDGGAVSACNPSTGNYDITSNGNTCASRSCSQRHEERHVSDLGPCCARLKAAIDGGGNRSALITRYNTWMETDGAHAWAECNAYGVSIACADQLMAANKCDSQSSVACDELQDYKTDVTAQQSSWCGRAPGSLPPCPF